MRSFTVLVPASDRNMLGHYGIDKEDKNKSHVWRTITPAVLPVSRTRGKRSGETRAATEAAIAHAARQALRHAGFFSNAEIRRIQREPFDSKGSRAESFANGRFSPGQLYHLEIAFDEPIAGPVLVGNGRYLGLGLMQPVLDAHHDTVILSILPDNLPPISERDECLNAVRRALMARARDLASTDDGKPGRLFSGHEPDGSPARSGRHDHVFLAADDADGDGFIDRLLIVAPWRADPSRNAWKTERDCFDLVANSLESAHSRKFGVIHFVRSVETVLPDRIFNWSRMWNSATLYVPTRYPKPAEDLIARIAEDLALECIRRALPRPTVEVLHIEKGPRGGVRAHARLIFKSAVKGPLMLGRNSHAGGGLFYAADHAVEAPL